MRFIFKIASFLPLAHVSISIYYYCVCFYLIISIFPSGTSSKNTAIERVQCFSSLLFVLVYAFYSLPHISKHFGAYSEEDAEITKRKNAEANGLAVAAATTATGTAKRNRCFLL